jgi:hypothetical protein
MPSSCSTRARHAAQHECRDKKDEGASRHYKLAQTSSRDLKIPRDVFNNSQLQKFVDDALVPILVDEFLKEMSVSEVDLR